MTQLSSAPLSDGVDRVLCYYINATSQLQIARITDLSTGCFERMIFPGQRLLFEAPPDALLEIHSPKAMNTSLLTQIPCEQLRVHEKLAFSDRTDVVQHL